MKEKIVKLTQAAVRHPLAVFWLALVSFAEASFFPLPPDMFLMPMVALRREKWFGYSLVTALYSVLGGLFGYFIGWVLYSTVAEPLIDFYNLSAQVEQVGVLFQGNTFWAVFVSAFTPIPYKVFTIASGIFRVDILIFLAASFSGRWLRFLFEAWLMKRFGEQIARAVFKSFNTLSVVFVLLVLAVILLLVKK